jgi:hypothetical protein
VFQLTAYRLRNRTVGWGIDLKRGDEAKFRMIVND